MPTRYPDSFKRNIIHRYEQGEAIQLLCTEYRIAPSTLYRWRKEYRTISTDAKTYTPAEFNAMSKHLKKLEREFQIIRQSGLIANIPLQNRLAFLEQFYREHSNFSVHELCEAMDVARGTFYNHIFRRADHSKYETERAELMMKIQQVFDESGQRYGAQKIHVILAEHGTQVSVRRVFAFMRELGLESIRTNAKKQYQKRQRFEKKNRLERKFTANYPNQVWVSDITSFKVKEIRLYLFVILDLYARKVIAHRVSRNSSTNLLTATFRTAYKDRGMPKDLTFHSDQGKQYTSSTFMKLLKKHGIKQSFSGRGQPGDNAVAETFFATFKKEEAYRREYASERHFRKSVDQYITFYNEVRPHGTLRYKTPQAYEEAYKAKQNESL